MVCLEYRSNYSTSRTGTSGKVLAQWRCNYIVCNADRSCLDWTGGPPVQVFDSDDDDEDDDNDNDNDDDGLSGLDWGPPVQFSHATTYAATGAFKKGPGKSFWYVVDCPTQLKSVFGYLFVFHDQAKRTQQGNLLIWYST